MIIEIRPAAPADVDSIAALNVDVQNIHAAAHPHIFKSVSDGEFAKTYIAEQLSKRDHFFFLANLDGEDVGYIFARIVRRPENAYMHAWNFVYIDQISVKPAHQGKGCGTALIQAVRDLAKEHNIDTIALDFWAFNEKARAFFTRQGFVTFNHRVWMPRTV